MSLTPSCPRGAYATPLADRRDAMHARVALIALVASIAPALAEADDSTLQLNLRSGVKATGKDKYAAREEKAAWDAKKTALIICDMWDDHWCKSAARRVGELAGPLNETVKAARARGVFIIHAPSSVTAFYKDAPQRKRAQVAPFSSTPVPLVT